MEEHLCRICRFGDTNADFCFGSGFYMNMASLDKKCAD